MRLTPDLVLDEQGNMLLDSGNEIEIGLTFAEAKVLACLAATPDEIFTKEDLLAIGWPDRVVAATSLTQCISTLRKKLEPYPQLQLKTAARRGYKLHIEQLEAAPELQPTAPLPQSEPVVVGRVSRYSNNLWFSGAALLMLLVSMVWYISDYHKMLKQRSQWHYQSEMPLNLGGIKDNAELYYLGDNTNTQANMWQKHLLPESQPIRLFDRFGAFAVTDGQTYSVGICPDFIDGYCAGKNLINITAINSQPAGLDIANFLNTSRVMENRIKYNRLPQMPEDDYSGDVLEHYYHSNIYFPVANELLIRADYSMSFVYESANNGVFFSSTCITDEDCETTPVSYKVRGHFNQYSQEIDGHLVDVFHVQIDSKELSKPDNVHASASEFYRKIRKHSIFDEELYFYRLYQDDNTAVWIVPMMGQLAVWMTRNELAM
ncbi:winged helix-turn-helix domain-containing protein [Ferrimonas senticii]|uniref:winged helix-turn-helix domain-containing protein n=1 Tax=Ferrimonas senticii TaxID=394566 RepID=UPI000418A12E|nr:winged helix-turn-helix domain-containing protein [Ferrimonas senticii]